MLKELFEGSFYCVHKKKDDALLMLAEEVKCGSFSLCDPIACGKCEHCIANPGEMRNLNVHSSNDVHVLGLSQVYELMDEELQGNCDYILESQNITCLVEMTCSQPVFVKRSKRSHARAQLYNTLCTLFEVPPIRVHEEKATKRYVIFSWKNTDMYDDNGDTVEHGFTTFTKFADETYSIDNEQNFDLGFRFKEVRYPDVFDFDRL